MATKAKKLASAHTLQMGDKVARTSNILYANYRVFTVTKVTNTTATLFCGGFTYIVYREGYQKPSKEIVFNQRPKESCYTFILVDQNTEAKINAAIEQQNIEEWWRTHKFSFDEMKRVYELLNTKQ